MRGAEHFTYNFEHGDCVKLEVRCIARFGKIQEAIPYHNGELFNTSLIMLDLGDDWYSMDKVLKYYAKEAYDESKNLDCAEDEEIEVIFIPEEEGE